MATIALYAHKVNQMPGLVRDIRKSVWDYKMELSLLEDVALRIDQDTCNVEDVVRSIRASAQVQEEKAASLEALRQEVEGFIEEVVRIDGEVAEAIRRRKEEFYELHPYLEPACEKGDWERFWDGCGEWCREHWKAVVTGVLVIAAVALICTGVGGPLGAILLGACKGLLVGVAIGGVLGGLSSVAAGRPFLEGLEDGALSGALLGAFFGCLGGLGWVLGSSGKVVGVLGPAARAIPAVFGTSTVVALGMFGFDLLALGTSLFSMDHPLVQWNKKLHKNGLYNAFQFTVSALAAFSGGFRKGMAGWKQAESGTSTLAQYGDDFGKMGTYVENPNIKVDWTRYAEHAAERMQQRGMTQEMVNNIVENGKVLSQNNGNKFAYITQEGVVIVSKEGKLITAWSSVDFDSSMLEIISKLFGE